jgi:hypothetical protein
VTRRVAKKLNVRFCVAWFIERPDRLNRGMKRRLLNLATILSVVLSLAALAMQVRSGYGVPDSWELPPRPAPSFNAEFQSGIVTHRHIESTAGRLVWVNYDVMEVRPIPPVFYQTAIIPLAPGQWGRDDPRHPREYLVGTEHGRIPYVVEWYLTPGGGWYIAVPWLSLFFAFALLPVARWLWSKRRARASTGPAFPVIPPRQSN